MQQLISQVAGGLIVFFISNLLRMAESTLDTKRDAKHDRKIFTSGLAVMIGLYSVAVYFPDGGFGNVVVWLGIVLIAGGGFGIWFSHRGHGRT